MIILNNYNEIWWLILQIIQMHSVLVSLSAEINQSRGRTTEKKRKPDYIAHQRNRIYSLKHQS